MEDIDPYITAAQASAAKLQNESYSREQGFVVQRNRYLREQTTDIGTAKLNVQKVNIQGELAVRDAEAEAFQEMLKTTKQAHATTEAVAKQLAEENRRHEAQMRNIMQNIQ